MEYQTMLGQIWVVRHGLTTHEPRMCYWVALGLCDRVEPNYAIGVGTNIARLSSHAQLPYNEKLTASTYK